MQRLGTRRALLWVVHPLPDRQNSRGLTLLTPSVVRSWSIAVVLFRAHYVWIGSSSANTGTNQFRC